MALTHSLVAIAAGATMGAWARWGLGLWLDPTPGAFPFGTLAANLVGGYGVGVAMAWFAGHPHIGAEWKLFVVTGLLGGLTTFSAFSAESVSLLDRHQFGWAAGSIALNLVGSLAMTALGLATVRALRPSLA